MNVIVLVSDTLRRDHLPCYREKVTPPRPELGAPYEIYAPHLTRFAQRSTVFDNAYTASFPTVPCRNDIMTGRYTFTYKPWSPLGDDETVLAEALNAAGYTTALFADTPHPFAPGYNYQRGFQAWDLIRGQEGDRWKSAPHEIELPADEKKLRGGKRVTTQYLRNVSWRRSEEDYFPARTARAACEWLEANHRRPFFLYVDTFDPHEPWDPPEHYVRRYMADYAGEKPIYPRYDVCDYLSTDELRYLRALYAGEVSLVDHWLGYLLQRVEDFGLWDETLILFMADHGFYLGEHNYIGKSLITPDHQQGLPLYPEVANVPFIVHLPGGQSGNRSGAYAQPVDVMPTALDFLGVEIPGSVQGRSLVPVLRGEQAGVRSFCVSSPTVSGPHVNVPHPTNRLTLTSGEWTLVYGSQAHDVDESEYTHMVDSIRRKIRTLEPLPIWPELYHLPSDPGCTKNVIREHEDVARRLHAELLQFLKDSGMEARHLQHFATFPAGLWG
ncbi:MAG TPA: sulfatase [Limnochordia bacterium]|nr:sulfatase [Limnochordia bacterium]